MERTATTNRTYTITLIFFVAVSFLISNLHLFFKDVHSDHPMFAYMQGDVEWWVYIVGFMINIVWLFAFAVYVGRSKFRMSVKQSLMIAVYCFSLYKDIYDWFVNNNQGTMYQDWIITIALWVAVQFLYDSAKKILGRS